MATKGLVIIEVEGGLVSAVHATPDMADVLTIEVYDYDAPDGRRERRRALCERERNGLKMKTIY